MPQARGVQRPGMRRVPVQNEASAARRSSSRLAAAATAAQHDATRGPQPPTTTTEPLARDSTPPSTDVAPPARNMRQSLQSYPSPTNLSAVQRALSNKRMSIPHAATRLHHQLRYVENISISELKEHVPAIRTIFLDILQLQLKLEPNARLHLLLESDHPTPSGDSTISTTDLLTLFSPTISSESRAQRDANAIIAEALVDFKLIWGTDAVRQVDTPIETPDSRPAPLPQTHGHHEQEPQSAIPRCGTIAHPSPLHSAHHETEQAATATPPAATVADIEPVAATARIPRTTRNTNQAPDGSAENVGSDELRRDRTTSPPLHDDALTKSKWQSVSPQLLQQIKLPAWYPSVPSTSTPEFRSACTVVEIDRFQHLTYKQALFVYSGLFHAGFWKQVQINKATEATGPRPVFHYEVFTPPGSPDKWIAV